MFSNVCYVARLILKPLQKNWAKGQRLTFLDGHLDLYRSAAQQNRTRGAEYADQVVNGYFKLFPWDLPLNVDPLPPQLLPAVGPMVVVPPLTHAEERHRKAVIKQMTKVRLFSSCLMNMLLMRLQSIPAWLAYRVKKVDGASSSVAAASNAPMKDLLNKLTGVRPSPPKLSCDWQMWAKDKWDDDFRKEFQKWFDCSIYPDRMKTAARQEFVEQSFRKLPKEEQASWTAAAAAAAAQAALAKKKRKEAGLNPESAQLTNEEIQM